MKTPSGVLLDFNLQSTCMLFFFCIDYHLLFLNESRSAGTRAAHTDSCVITSMCAAEESELLLLLLWCPGGGRQGAGAFADSVA